MLGSAPTGSVRVSELDIRVISLASLSVYLLPLIALMRLTLVFPDKAPSRARKATLVDLVLEKAEPESEVAAGLTALQERHREVETGSYPFLRDGRFGCALVVRSEEASYIQLPPRATWGASPG